MPLTVSLHTWYQRAMDTLTDDRLRDELHRLEGWEADGDTIRRTLEFDSFPEAIAFINRVATLAQAANHHPELTNVYSRVEVTLTSHDAGGVTEKDLELAERINGVVTA